VDLEIILLSLLGVYVKVGGSVECIYEINSFIGSSRLKEERVGIFERNPTPIGNRFLGPPKHMRLGVGMSG
jgi:hypothetical protein